MTATHPKKTRLELEQMLVTHMISLYCRRHHTSKTQAVEPGDAGLCRDCRALVQYASLRLERCPFGQTKSSCSACPVHCYKPEMRQQIRAVMRYAGPRILFHKPLLYLRYRYARVSCKNTENINP